MWKKGGKDEEENVNKKTLYNKDKASRFKQKKKCKKKEKEEDSVERSLLRMFSYIILFIFDNSEGRNKMRIYTPEYL